MGTTISLKLPLTLAIIQVLLVGVGREQYAVPLSQIHRTLEFLPCRDPDLTRAGMDHQRGGPHPLIPPWGPYWGSRTGEGIVGGPWWGSWWSGEVTRWGWWSRRLLEYREAVVKPLRGLLRKVKGFAGATIMGDGSMVLILDLNTLIDSLLSKDEFLIFPSLANQIDALKEL